MEREKEKRELFIIDTVLNKLTQFEEKRKKIIRMRTRLKSHVITEKERLIRFVDIEIYRSALSQNLKLK